MRKLILLILITVNFLAFSAWAEKPVEVPIYTYHNFDPLSSGSMTIKTEIFEKELKTLFAEGYTVIPLQDLVAYLQGKKDSLPDKSVVITVDDGKASVYSQMRPIVEQYKIPVTLFIYPSAISNASYAMTWDQLRELQNTGYFDIQSHTYWHPNFKQEKKKLSEQEYEKFVKTQLVNSKKTLESKMGKSVTLLAWPFGIYDDYLEEQASLAGYEMAFSIDGRDASKSEKMMSQPRYLK